MAQAPASDAVAAEILDTANAEAVRVMVANLADDRVVAVYQMTGGTGFVADLAAEQMEQRNLDL